MTEQEEFEFRARLESETSAPKPAQKPVETPWLERQRNGLATAPINAYLGVKQFFGGLDPIEQNILEQNKQAEKDAPIASLASNVGMVAPTMFLPGANTVTGAGVVGALQGLFQPVEGEQTLSNIAKGKAINTGVGGVLGAVSQFGANKAAGYFSGNLADKTAEAAATQSKNSMRDAALSEGRQAGYTVPNSEIAPSFIGNRLESIGGKAATKQEATLRNQDITNALTKQALGLSDSAPISQSTLDTLRKTAGKSYAEVSALSPQAAADLEALKVARNEATGWFAAYNRSARPDDLAKAKAARTLSDQLETALESHAKAAGRNDLVPDLVSARKLIAKTYTVERALNKATGDVSAPVIGRMFNKGKPLSDGLDTVGKFNQAFPKFTGTATTTPAAGVSKSEALASLLLGGGGMAAAGPAGMAAAALPLLSHPARALALSKGMQKVPSYGTGLGTRLLALPNEEAWGLLGRGGAGFMAPSMGGLLSAQ